MWLYCNNQMFVCKVHMYNNFRHETGIIMYGEGKDPVASLGWAATVGGAEYACVTGNFKGKDQSSFPVHESSPLFIHSQIWPWIDWYCKRYRRCLSSLKEQHTQDAFCGRLWCPCTFLSTTTVLLRHCRVLYWRSGHHEVCSKSLDWGIHFKGKSTMNEGNTGTGGVARYSFNDLL